MRRLTPKEILAESFRELAENQSISKITVKDIAEKGKRCCIIIANRAIVRQHLNYFLCSRVLFRSDPGDGAFIGEECQR